MEMMKESWATKGMTEWGKELAMGNLALLAVQGLILAGIATTASSFFGGSKDTEANTTAVGSIEGGNEDWTCDKPVSYGLQQGTTRAVVTAEESALEYSFESTDDAAKDAVEEKVPKGSVMKSAQEKATVARMSKDQKSVLRKSTAAT